MLSKINSIVKFLRDYFKKNRKKTAVVGVSGGLDSSVVCLLCAQALGSNFVYPLFIPYRPFTVKKSLENVRKIVKLAKIPEENLIIEEITEQINLFKKNHPEISRIDLGNKISRERMSLLYFYARRLDGLVVGTSNKSERLLGYFTLHGDGAWDIGPIAHLYKTEVRKLAEILKLPKGIIKAAPSAGFWPSQTDEKELGFSYQTADKILKLFIEEKLSPSQIEKKGFSRLVIRRVLDRYQKNKFKLKQRGVMIYNQEKEES